MDTSSITISEHRKYDSEYRVSILIPDIEQDVATKIAANLPTDQITFTPSEEEESEVGNMEVTFNWGLEAPKDVTISDYKNQQARESALLVKSAIEKLEVNESAGEKVSTEGANLDSVL